MHLSDDEKRHILACIEKGEFLPEAYLEKLFSLPSGGRFSWEGKYTASEAFLCDSYKHIVLADTWKNLLFQGDNLAVLYALLEEHNAQQLQAQGGVSLVYIDPPYSVGTDFHMLPLKKKKGSLQRTSDEKVFAYSDKWENIEAYYSMMFPRLKAIHQLLSDTGCLCLHCDWRVSSALRFMLDEIFGAKNFLNEVVWHYTGGGRSQRYFSRKHDTLLVYAKGTEWTFNVDAIRVPYKKTSGYARSGIVGHSGKRYMPNPKGSPVDDVWDIPIINPMASERIGYATQKPVKLLERILLALTNPGDIVADFFCGSGTTVDVASSLGRRWIGCDKGDASIATITKRLRKENSEEQRTANDETYLFYSL